MIDRMIVGLALMLLRKHGWRRYKRCTTPEQRRAALKGQADGLVRHDRVLAGRVLV